VQEALRDGALMVLVVLVAFLMSARTTMISLTAIPLSIAVTLVVFSWLGLTINTMTLGGIAIAVGELVDDAVVDVENILRRLRQRGGDSILAGPTFHSASPRRRVGSSSASVSVRPTQATSGSV